MDPNDKYEPIWPGRQFHQGTRADDARRMWQRISADSLAFGTKRAIHALPQIWEGLERNPTAAKVLAAGVREGICRFIFLRKSKGEMA